MARPKPTRFRRPRHWTLAQYLDHYSIPEPNSGCRLWTGAVGRSGYGNAKWQGEVVSAHRLAWRSVNGAVPDGMDICHKCDVTICINEAHLFPGTRKDNVDDARRKGRWPSGATSVRAKLSTDQVSHIRGSDLGDRELAGRFGITASQIWRIRSGHSWKTTA